MRRIVSRSLSSGRIALASVVLVAAGCAVRAPSVTRVTEPGSSQIATIGRSGIYYALPRTVLRISVPFERTKTALTDLGKAVVAAESAAAIARDELDRTPETDPNARKRLLDPTVRASAAQKPAELARAALVPAAGAIEKADPSTPSFNALRALLHDDETWSERVLGVPLADVEEGVEYALAKGTSIEATAEADPDNVYFVELDGGPLQEQSVKLQLSKLGLLTSAASSTKDTTSDVVKAVVGTVAQVAGSVIGLGAAGLAAPAIHGVAPADRQKMQTSTIPAAAQRLGDELTTLRTARVSLLAPERSITGIEAATVGKMLDEIDARVEEILAAFVTETTLAWTCVCEVRPAGAPCAFGAVPESALLRWSPSTGVVAMDRAEIGLKAVAVPPAFAAAWPSGQPPADANTLSLSTELAPDQFCDRVRQSQPLLAPERRSIHYRVPKVAVIRVLQRPVPAAPQPEARPSSGAKPPVEVAWERVQVAQLGAVASLPAVVEGSGYDYSTEFYEALGALQSVSLQKTAVEAAGAVTAVGEAASGLIDAEAEVKKARVAARRKPTEVEVLETRKQTLELELEILELEEKLNQKKKPLVNAGGG